MSDLDKEPTTRRPVINWPERISKLEICQGDLKEMIVAMNETMQQAMFRNAESNERIAAHLEQSRRIWDRVDELEHTINELDKALIELRAQNRQLLDFSAGIKKAGWIFITCGGVVLWWIIQRWVEQHGR
jgi:chromosome segregation ATPase